MSRIRIIGVRFDQMLIMFFLDFERALELDPLSPAKKELEVARRQVTRRIGY